MSSSITDWLQIILTALGGGYALYLFKESNREKRNQYVDKVLKMLYDDDEIRQVLYYTDSDDLNNTIEIKRGGKLEKQADKTLRYLSYIGLQISKKNLRITDLTPFKYEIESILKDENVIQYILWLKQHNVNLDGLSNLKFE